MTQAQFILSLYTEYSFYLNGMFVATLTMPDRIYLLVNRIFSPLFVCSFLACLLFVDDDISFVLQGLRLELCTNDRVGLLSDVTRIFREHGLSVTRADVSTKGDIASNVFYVTDAAGNPVDDKSVEAVRREIGQTVLRVTPPQNIPLLCKSASGKARFSLANFLGKPSQVLFNLGLIKSCS